MKSLVSLALLSVLILPTGCPHRSRHSVLFDDTLVPQPGISDENRDEIRKEVAKDVADYPWISLSTYTDVLNDVERLHGDILDDNRWDDDHQRLLDDLQHMRSLVKEHSSWTTISERFGCCSDTRHNVR